MRILLSDGSGLTVRQVVTRLSALGHEVEAISSTWRCLNRFTAHVRRIHRVPPFQTDAPVGSRHYLLMGIEIRLFPVIDAFSRFSGTPLACFSGLSLRLAKQLLDSTAAASGSGPGLIGAGVAVPCWLCFKNPRLAPESGGFSPPPTLLDILQKRAIDVLLPTQEQVAWLSAYRRQISVPTVLPDFSALSRVEDKIAAFETLTALATPQPMGCVVRSPTEKREDMAFPVVVKRPNSTASSGVRRADDVAGLASAMSELGDN